MAVSVNLDKALDKAYENSSLEEDPGRAAIGAGRPDPGRTTKCWPGLGIKTIQDLGSNKYFAVAGVLVALSGKTG